MIKEKTEKKTKGLKQRTRSRLLFYVLLLAFPLLQNAIFYVGVNLNVILIAFQKYETGVSGYAISFAGFENFKLAWTYLTEADYMFVNSLILYAMQTIVGMTLALVFAYYIYKNFALSGFFKVLLFLPQIVSGMVFALLFKYFSGATYVSIVQKLTGKEVLGLLADSNTRFITVVMYSVFISFGVKMLMFSGAMSSIDYSVVESAQLDGANLIVEFTHITLPLIYPTIVSFLVIGLTGIFTDQMHLYSMFGGGAKDIATIGYYLYSSTTNASLVVQNSQPTYGILSASGLMISIVVVPIVILVRKALNTFGPSVE